MRALQVWKYGTGMLLLILMTACSLLNLAQSADNSPPQAATPPPSATLDVTPESPPEVPLATDVKIEAQEKGDLPAACPENLGKLLITADSIPAGLPGTNFDVYLINADGTGKTNLTADHSTYDAGPAWSPERCRVAYVRQDEPNNEELWVMRADGSDAHPITFSTENDREPDWSPDGEWIVFMSERKGNRDLFLIRPDGTEEHALTDSAFDEEDPAWSPDGEWIVFSAQQEGNWDLFLIHPDGSGLTQITQDKMQDRHPAWSPDGEWIAFESNRSHSNEIYRIQRDGSGLQQITAAGGNSALAVTMDLTWSPDGNWLAFTGWMSLAESRLSDKDILIIGADGSGLHDLSGEDIGDHEPAW